MLHIISLVSLTLGGKMRDEGTLDEKFEGVHSFLYTIYGKTRTK